MALMILIALAIAVLGSVIFERNKQSIQLNAQKNLARIADLKADEIIQWRKERLDDATILTESSKIVPIFEGWLRAGAPENTDRQWMRLRLESMNRSQNYSALSLLDPQARVRLSLENEMEIAGYRQQLALQAMRQHKVIMSDLHPGSSEKPELDMIAPLLIKERDSVRVVGALSFEIDPASFLFPKIRSWEADNQNGSAEFMLVRRQGDQVLYLNELRHRSKTALQLQLPLDTPDLLEAQAALGKTGFISGVDYRGHRAVAYLRQIPDTSWALVSKIDEDEIYAPVRQLALWTSALALFLIGVSIAVIWTQKHRARLHVRNLQLQQEKTLLSQRFEDLSRFANDIFLLADESGRIVEVNDRAVEVYGYSRAELLQMNGAELRTAEAVRQFQADWQTVLTQGHAHYETIHRRKDGETFTIDVSSRVLQLENGRFVQLTWRDITKRKKSEQRLQYLAYYDDLTGLPNRALFRDHLGQAMAAAERRHQLVGVMLMDLDRFKNVNDILGHEVGDALLTQVAIRLKTCFRESDTVSRFGGDEFAVVLADMVQPDDAVQIAQKVLTAFEAPFKIGGNELFTSFSIGITLYPLDSNDSQALLRNADAALYHAKALGRGNFQYYSAELTQRVRKRMALEIGLRHALERGEFVLHYQPQQDLKTGLITGVEALLRWEHPGRGMVSPLEFIPVAEESGLIVPLGEWVLRSACAQAKAWQDQGLPPLTMAINLSSRQFAQGRLADLVKTVLRETGLSPRGLELEITESILMDGSDSMVLSTLNEFKRLGITLAIDDFGTGYSSLSYLKRFPIDKLKIDQAFVRDITRNPEDASLVQAIIAIGRSLRLTVVAEGVETEEQHDHLCAHDCDQIQGYFFSRPLSASQIGELLRARQRLLTGAATD